MWAYRARAQKAFLSFKKRALVGHFSGPGSIDKWKIKKIKDNKSAWIWYTGGDTATLTDFSLISPLLNDYCLEDILNKKEVTR